MTEPEFLTAALPATHGFFTRRGGVSTGPYASLNCALSGQDDPSHVAQNRAGVARALGAAPTNLIGLHQVHGDVCVTVDEPWRPGAGPRADAMVTAVPGIALGIITADCVPVLFVDPKAGIVGGAHAGWRGAVAGVLESTIAAMVALGAATGRIQAAIGPCIHQPSYEVGLDFREAVLAVSPDAENLFAPARRDAHWQFDLPAYCVQRLAKAGIGPTETLPADTVSDEARFFSHRRRTLAGGGPIGHQISVIVC